MTGPTGSIVRPGRLEEISFPSNPRIKAIKALALKKYRDRESTFLAEGQKLVTDALETGWVVDTLLYSKSLVADPGQKERIETLAARVRARGGDVLIVTNRLLTSITRRDNAQAVIAVLKQPVVLDSDMISKDNDCWIALDRIRDPGNLGTIIRTADALGAKGIILIGETTDPFAPEAVRATMGSLFHIPVIRMSEGRFIERAEHWKQSGGQIIGTHLKGAVDHRSVDYSKGPQLVLMGSEQQGLTEPLTACCSCLTLIAMEGAADSLNLAVATGIMVFEVRRHRLGQNVSMNSSQRSQ